MKNIILSIALFSVFLAAVVIIPSTGSPGPCVEPLTYRIASIDPRYDIDQKQLTKIMKDVGKLWSTVLNKPLINYNESGEIAIHLVYSDNQYKSRQEQKLSNKIEVKRQQITLLKQQYERLSDLYEKKENRLKKLFENHNQMVQRLNESFVKWRARGISENKEHIIREKKRQISNIKYRVDQQYAEIKSLRNRLNQKSKQLNALTTQTNELIKAYNQKFAEIREFHQGRYVQRGDLRMIKIFQFNNRKELSLVLAHEIGHALGLDHVENPESIMYYLMSEQNVVDLALSKEDIEALENHCES
ncbi:MAG TPA: matrixin family metalloprotease [Balneolaceae bacterium]